MRGSAVEHRSKANRSRKRLHSLQSVCACNLSSPKTTSSKLYNYLLLFGRFKNESCICSQYLIAPCIEYDIIASGVGAACRVGSLGGTMIGTLTLWLTGRELADTLNKRDKSGGTVQLDARPHSLYQTSLYYHLKYFIKYDYKETKIFKCRNNVSPNKFLKYYNFQ